MIEKATDVRLYKPPEFNIWPVFTGHSWGLDDLMFQQWEANGTTPKNYTAIYTLMIFRDKARKDLMATKVLTTSDNRLIVGQTKEENVFKEETTYYFDVIEDASTEMSKPYMRGTLIVYRSR